MDKLLTFNDFDLKKFKDEKNRMEEFRKNCCGEKMESIWETVRESYLPLDQNIFDRVSATYTLDTDGSATPDKLFMTDNDDERLMAPEPLVAIKIHTALSILTQRTPDVKWDSDSDTYERRVPVLDAMRRRDWDDDDSRAQYAMMWFYMIMYGTTYWRRYYEKETRTVFMPQKLNMVSGEVEFEEQEKVIFDQTTAEALSPFDVWIDPATRPMRPRSMRRVIYRKVYDYDKFLIEFEGKVSKKKLEKVKPKSIVEDNGDNGEMEGDNWVECFYYENMDLDLYYIVANGEEIMKEHLPYSHKRLSVCMATWMPRKSSRNPFGLGPIEMMLPDKKILDQFKSMTLTQMKFSIYKSIFYSGTLGSEGEGGDIRIRPDRAYKVLNAKDINFMEMPGPGAEAWKSLEFLRERIDDASGINRPLGGEIVKTTAFQTDLAKDAALARLSLPINNVVRLLKYDAELMFELQKQYYALPDVEEVVDPDVITEAIAELQQARAQGKNAEFDLWINANEGGEIEVFKATPRQMQLQTDMSPEGSAIPSSGKRSVVVTADIFDWKGKIRVVADSLFTMTPTVERVRKMEMYNLLIPLYKYPPELMAKTAKSIVRLYGEDPKSVLPDQWLQYLQQVESGVMPMQPPMGSGGEQPPGRPREFGVAAGEAAQAQGGFQQEAAERVVTNIGGQKDMISAHSQQMAPKS